MANIVIGVANSDTACAVAMSPNFRSLVRDVPTLVRGYKHRGIKCVSFELSKEVLWAEHLKTSPGDVVRHYNKIPPGVEPKVPKLVPTLLHIELAGDYLELSFQNKSTKVTTKPIRIADFEAILKRFRA